MAHITEITIEGLLGRKEPIHLQLNRDINIFFGENGCGKTTLLKVLDAALSLNGAAMNRLPVTKASVDIFSIDENKIIRHTWERSEQERSKQLTQRQLEMLEREYADTPEGAYLLRYARTSTEWKQSPTRRKKSATSRWAHTFLPTTRLYFGEVSSGRPAAGRPQKSEEELDQVFSDSVKRAWLQFYSRTLNEVRNIQESGLRAVLRHVLNPEKESAQQAICDAEEVYTRVANFLARQSQSHQITLGSLGAFKKRYDQDSNLRKIVDNLGDVEQSIERAMIPVNRFLETISHLFSRGKKLGLADNELQVLLSDGQILPIAQLSSGEKHIIKILLSSMMAGPNSVLIDEPELSMHIDWQRLFVQTILSLNPNCQLILASHSPEVMADVPDNCIFKL